MSVGIYWKWTGTGVVHKKRELTSPKNEKWRGWVLTMNTLGATLDVQFQEKSEWEKYEVGQLLKMSGWFEFRGSHPNFWAAKVEVVAQPSPFEEPGSGNGNGQGANGSGQPAKRLPI